MLTYLTKKQATILGHLQQPQKGLWSTQEKELRSEQEIEPEPEPDRFPLSAQSECTNLVFINTVDCAGKFYTDQTRRFPITSRNGNKYILVAYHYDSNTIHVKPLKTRTGIELKTSYHKLCNLLNIRGLKPSLHILDNECINMIKTFMRVVYEKFQLVPPHIHCINSAELSIWTFKEHFI